MIGAMPYMSEKEIDLSTLNMEISNEDKEAWIKAHPEVENWLRGKKNRLNMAKDFMKYCEAVGYFDNPEKLLDLRKFYRGKMSQDGIILLEKFQEAYIQKVGRKTPLLWNITKQVKSFYAFHDMGFPRQRAKCLYHKVRKKIQWRKEDLLKFTEGQSRKDTAIVSFLSCVPCRLETLTKLNWYHVREVLDQTIQTPHVVIESELLKGQGYGQDIEQHSFLHSWAKESLLRWKEEYEELTGKKILLSNAKSLEEPLWISDDKPYHRLGYSGIEDFFMKRSEECGIKITPHSFRAFVSDALTTDDDTKAIFLGHSSKWNGAYSMRLEERLRDVFLEATPRLNPLYEDKMKTNRAIIDKIAEKYQGQLSENAREELAKQFSMGLVTIEKQMETMKEQFMTDFLKKIEENLSR